MRRTDRTITVRATAAVSVLGLAFGVSACGGGTTGPASSSGESVTVAGVWTGSEQKNFKKVLDTFSEKTGVKTVFVPSGDNVSTFVGSKIEGGNAPDVVMVPQVGVLQQFAKEGWLKPLSSTTAKTAANGLAPVWQNYGTVGDTYYGLYFKAAHKSTIWYTPEAFSQAGVSTPGTYDDLLKAGRALADSGLPAFAVAGEDGWTLTDWFENIYLSQAGPEKYDRLAKHELKWTDPSVVAALTTLGQLFKDDQLVAGGAKTALQTDFPGSVEKVFGPEPKAGMVYEGDFVGGVAKDEFGRKLGEDTDFFPFPAVGGGKAPVVSGGDAAVVLKDGRNSAAGMKLVEFLATPEAAEIWAGAGGYLSPNKNVSLDAYENDTTRATAKSLVAAGDSVRFDMSDQAPAAFGGTKGAGEWKLLQDFLRDPSDPKGTAAKLESAASKAYES
ncbi:ABC transporter substrate-binding protein [Streptomyces sp. ADI93-02]|uniref:ABC transporter substrate-binding protein n=1 Tax=Streptomyces sp. ADI93-02 TaxID=1522757 RepID=UPI000F551993|nr:ABC transporter substrate-binding protein [Streptomyces sp. ADI93-02]RPK32966.1 Multiple sugar-binding protein precursor [Streptomyces sp. ADI93-02]